MYNNLIKRALQCFGKENMQSVLLLGILDLLKMTLIQDTQKFLEENKINNA